MKRILPLIVATSLAPATSYAAVSLTSGGAWPSTPDVQVSDNTQDSNSQGVRESRIIGQAFTVGTTFQLDKLYIETNGVGDNVLFDLRIFQVADVNAGGPATAGTVVLDIDDISTGTGLSEGVLEMDFTGADEVTLTALTGTAGYVLELISDDTSNAFGWRYDATGSYSGGRMYGTGNSSHDATLALVAVAVPEPSSTALLGLGGLALILRRRKN